MADVRRSIDDGVATITLNRPEVRNAARGTTIIELHKELAQVARTDGVRVLVVRAEGSAFCAGEDLAELEAELATGTPDVPARVALLQDLTRVLVALPVPTIAIVHGPAVGFGAELALACDIRVGGPAASFAFPETRWGLFPTNGVIDLLGQIVGRGRARDWLLTGRTIGADEATAAGALSPLGEDPFVLAADLAQRIVRADPLATRLVRELLAERQDRVLEATLDAELAATLRCVEESGTLDRVAGFTSR